jgi:hypothetical protein
MGVIKLNPEIIIVIAGGNVVAIATAGEENITVRIIDLDVKKVGGEPVTDLAPDIYGVNMEEYTKEIMED